jgi:hypothetical protein
MEPKERRQIGAHYTSERDIMKVIRSLFLDDLRAEFENRKKDRSTARRARIQEFHDKLCSLNFLDPACGCGNFLVIAYRELRLLELETLKELFGKQTEMSLDQINKLSQVDVDQFYGIEIGEWPTRIAEVALWLMDHQMNLKVSEAFGQLYQRLPLKKSPHIHCANALRIDWKTVIAAEKCSFILGNPPFVGKKARNASQQGDMDLVFHEINGTGVLDYVCCWYLIAAKFIQGTVTRVAFVSTNSITQGEQPAVLWPLLYRLQIKIHFAHRTFDWMSEARGKANVDVVIIGFAAFDSSSKTIYDYDGEKPIVVPAKNISPYLTEGRDFALGNRAKPIADVPPLQWGSMPNDDGNFLFTDAEKIEFLKAEPSAQKFFRPMLGAKEYLHGMRRWCLWLHAASPSEIRSLPKVKERVEAVKVYRAASQRATTQQLAATPSLFGEVRQPTSNFVLVPLHSSENRKYVPLGYFDPSTIINNSCSALEGADFFHFGVLSSTMHMAWMRQVCGRLESRYRYSGGLVYNNFPWPTPTAEQRERVEEKAKAVLAAREPHLPPKGTATLADLYDPLSMPPALLKAHTELDRAVEKCYRSEPFHSDRERVEFLFALYEKLTAPLLPVEKGRRGRKKAGQRALKIDH